MFSPDLGDFASDIYSIDMSSPSPLNINQQGSGAASKMVTATSNPRSSSTADKAKEEIRKRKTASYAGIRAVNASREPKSPPKKRQHTLPSNLFSPIPKQKVEELTSGSAVDLSSGKYDFVLKNLFSKKIVL